MDTLSFGAFVLLCLGGWTAQPVHANTCIEKCEVSYLAQIWDQNVLQNYCIYMCRNERTTQTTRGTTQQPQRQRISTPKQPTVISGRCGLQPPRERVVGGREARACEYPWVVAVNITDKFCGGSILDSRHILTAAHCVKSVTGRLLGSKDIKVRVGSSTLADMVSYNVRNVLAHPRHSSSTRDYDVAVLTLENTITEACAAPICLPDGIAEVSERDYCVVAGWGTLAYHSKQISPNLRAARVPLVNQNSCARSYNGRQYINDLKLCAGNYVNGGVDACRGDSGGPYMCQRQGVWYQFGIVSFGTGCARPYYPGVYTRVSNAQILNFIHYAMRY